jgi:recombinational DNA repair protein (RecF pathway)
MLLASLRFLENHPKPVVCLLWAETKLLEVSGFLPQFDRCVATGEPVATANPFVSPSAGGYVSESACLTFVDRFRTRAEILYGLARLPEFEEPPAHMKLASETLADLLPFWRAIAETPLPANESVVKEVRHATPAL